MAKTAEIKLHNKIGQKRNGYDTTEYNSGAAFAADLAKAMASDADDITISTAGLGGSVFDGNIIVASIMGKTKPVNGEIKGIAASMHYFALLPCNKISATRNSWIMTHSVQGSVQGSPTEMREEADLLDKMNSTIAEQLSQRTGLTIEEVTAKYLDKEAWFTAQEALDLKLIDAILDYDAEDMPEISAGITLQEATDRFTAMKTGKPKKGFVAELTAFISNKLGIKERGALKLSDNEEWFLQYQIGYLQSIVDSCDSILGNTSTPEIIAYAKQTMKQASADIIMLVTLLYGEEEQDATAARVKEVIAKVAEKTGSHRTITISAEKTIAMVEEFIAPKLAEKDAEIARLTADVTRLENKPVTKPSTVEKKSDDVSASKTGALTERIETEHDVRQAKLDAINNFSFEKNMLGD